MNGLKLINDSFGHFAGDELISKVAEIIKKKDVELEILLLDLEVTNLLFCYLKQMVIK